MSHAPHTPDLRMNNLRRAVVDIAHKQDFVDRWCWLVTSQDGRTVTDIAETIGMSESEVRLAAERGHPATPVQQLDAPLDGRRHLLRSDYWWLPLGIPCIVCGDTSQDTPLAAVSGIPIFVRCWGCPPADAESAPAA